MAAITEDERRRLKLLRILETAGQRVLTYTLQCGTPTKLSTVTLVQYLDNLPQDSTANYTKERNPSRCFNVTDLRQINGDPSCTTFDVTLLHKAIKLACENVAGPNEMVNNVNVWTSPTPLPGWELEHFTSKIKNTRNYIVHEGQPFDEAAFLKEVATLRALFDSCLRVTKNRYVRDNAEYRTERAVVQAKVTDIQQETLGITEMLQRSATRILPDFKEETDQELKKGLDSARYLTPLHFLSGIPEHRVEVSDIFCDITLAEERGTAHPENADRVPYLEVLRLCEGATAAKSMGVGLTGGAKPSAGARPPGQALVVEGEAGSGKTTWVRFLVQQWLTPQDHRRVQGLERYELMLRVMCRERSSPTLEGLVQQLLPESYLRYRSLLLPLLKKCRFLVIIDGIDEMNDVSRPLVANILSEAAATAFTVVCTSRPHSVQDLKAEARRMHFQVSHVRILGVSDTQRTELVVRHYQWLSAGAKTAADPDDLKQAVRRIVRREVFRLPLNLLFLATVFFYEPHRLSTSLSQGDLYQYIHTWCREKLQARLEVSSPTGWPRLGESSLAGRARVSRQRPVDKVFAVIHEVALKGLLQDRMCLNDQDLQDVEDACTTEGLESSAVLSAFYNMRREVTAGVVKETYMAPHKSLQEFMAAKGIAGLVRQYSEGAIERVLRVYTAGQDPPLDKLQQTLVHLLSLLTRQGDAMKEVVDLLLRSGVTRTNDWLWLLTNAMAPDSVAQHATEQLISGGLDNDEHIVLRDIDLSDKRVDAASVILQNLPQRKVKVYLRGELTDADNLTRVLAGHKVIYLCLHHHWRHPHQHTTSATLLRRLPRSDLRVFIGNLNAEDLALLPRGLECLNLVVRDSTHGHTLLPALAETIRSLPDLGIINLHIPAAVITPASLTCLPTGPNLYLHLSGVTNQLAEAAGDIVAAVCPMETGFRRLSFPEATLDLRGWNNLFSRMVQAGVKVRDSVSVPDTHVREDEEMQLNILATTMLGCGKVYRVSNNYMW